MSFACTRNSSNTRHTSAEMITRRILLVAALLFFYCVAQGVTGDPKCASISKPGHSLKLSINSWKNETGDWVTRFSAWKDSKIPSNNMSVDVSHKVIECEGKQIVYIEGAVNDLPFEYSNQKLLFHPNCGKNAAISNDGRTAQKINLDVPLDGVVLTNRPLKNNELFEVRLDKKNTKFQYSFGIGITIHSPEGFNIPDHMYNMKSGNWMMYHAHLYKDGVDVVTHYGRNLNDLVVGDRVGVLRNNYGALHFYVNGVDQGPAASNIPYPVYGVFELYHNAVKGTIVDNSTP